MGRKATSNVQSATSTLHPGIYHLGIYRFREVPQASGAMDHGHDVTPPSALLFDTFFVREEPRNQRERLIALNETTSSQGLQTRT